MAVKKTGLRKEAHFWWAIRFVITELASSIPATQSSLKEKK
jgi:hypothetical protein